MVNGDGLVFDLLQPPHHIPVPHRIAIPHKTHKNASNLKYNGIGSTNTHYEL